MSRVAEGKRRRRAHRVCRVEELPPGERKIVQIGKLSIGVFNLKGTYYALRNACPHQLAPLCLGQVCGTALPSKVGEYRYGREGEIVRCPWHGWEFDIKTGQSVFNPHKVKARSYEVAVEGPGGQTGAATRSAENPDPAVESYPAEGRAGHVVVYV